MLVDVLSMGIYKRFSFWKGRNLCGFFSRTFVVIPAKAGIQ
jgi:hypothetical protein